jgi:serine/threonine protein kinase
VATLGQLLQKDLLKKMLVLNFEKRITINKILEHPFITKDCDKYNKVNLPI